jgi:tRNA(Ser,Leu) C12 N-acetylase TAN1
MVKRELTEKERKIYEKNKKRHLKDKEYLEKAKSYYSYMLNDGLEFEQLNQKIKRQESFDSIKKIYDQTQETLDIIEDALVNGVEKKEKKEEDKKDE